MITRMDFPKRIHRIADSMRIRKRAYIGRKNIHEIRQHQILSNRMTLDDILEVHLSIKALQISRALFAIRHSRSSRHSAPCQIATERFHLIRKPRNREIFRKRERPNMNDLPAIPKVRRNIIRKHLRIRSRHINIDILELSPSIKNIVERNICRFTIFWRDLLEIDSGRQNLVRLLNLINKDIIRLLAALDFLADVFIEFERIPQLDIGLVIQIDGDYLRPLDAIFQKSLTE